MVRRTFDLKANVNGANLSRNELVIDTKNIASRWMSVEIVRNAIVQKIFQHIYNQRLWGENSGPGSIRQGLKPYFCFLSEVLSASGPSAIIDLGCGFFFPYEEFDWGSSSYLGVDVVPECVEANLRYSGANRRFLLADWIQIPCLPKADLAICKDVLQHWSNADISRGLKALSKYPLVILANSSEHACGDLNSDIITGDFRPLNLLLEPFCIQPLKTKNYIVSTSKVHDVKQIILWRPSEALG